MSRATIYEGTAPGRHPVTYGTGLHKGTAAVAIRVNKMNISPMSIRFTRPTTRPPVRPTNKSGDLWSPAPPFHPPHPPAPHCSSFRLPTRGHICEEGRKNERKKKKETPTGGKGVGGEGKTNKRGNGVGYISNIQPGLHH